MTDEEIAAIRARVDAAKPIDAIGNATEEQIQANLRFVYAAYPDTCALLAEVERLRAQNAAMREIVQAVATDDVSTGPYATEWVYDSEDEAYACHCVFCGESCSAHHTPDCPVTKARAILAAEQDQETGQ